MHYRFTLLRVVDGDTLEVDIELGFGLRFCGQRLRLWGVNCPECRGPTRDAGLAASRFVEDCLRGQQLVMTLRGKDSFGRWLAEVRYGEQQRDLATTLLDAGQAKLYSK
jgi:micrococcal nuclease